MGCDGGTIPRRDELVRLKKKPEQKDKVSELAFKWRCCAITQQPLQSPIVACGLGRLYNKQSVIESLLSKSLPEKANHIKNLKDIKNLKLKDNPEYKPNKEKNEGSIDVAIAPFICPMIGLEMSGRFRFVFLWSCGCVFSERALKEVKTSACIMCQQPYSDDDIVIINGTEEDEPLMKERMTIRQLKNKKSKSKKEKSSTVTSESLSTENGQPSNIEIKNEDVQLKISQPAIKVEHGTVHKSLKRTNDLKLTGDPDFKKSKETYSVAKDNRASEVYKSLFTSHKTEQEQDRAHWVTYNPFYN